MKRPPPPEPTDRPATEREALRALFRRPKYNRCDGLDDYAEDYRAILVDAGDRGGTRG